MSRVPNGSVGEGRIDTVMHDELLQLNLDMKNSKNETKYYGFHGDQLIGDKIVPTVGIWDDLQRVATPQNFPTLLKALKRYMTGQALDPRNTAPLVGSLSNDSALRRKFVEKNVKDKYDKMLHPPLTYLGDAFQYRQADGKYNSVLSPHLGQAGAPYAKTVPSKTHPLGALPDPGDLFDRLMARQEGGRDSHSGLSSMLIYHATIIIHDIFRTNENDKNISDSSSYLDLSPLYGYTDAMQMKVRDTKYKLGLLKPDTFAEDRLLRQPPGVCIMLVMYNRYHNYAATQLRRINENGRFSVPSKYVGTKLEALARKFYTGPQDQRFVSDLKNYNDAWKKVQALEPSPDAEPEELQKFQSTEAYKALTGYEKILEKYISMPGKDAHRQQFETLYDAAWDKLDNDLFNTARLITCGIYIQISIHDYLRALMGFHQFNSNFTLDPRLEIDHRNVSRGIGNQVTVEFNLLYRFHCAISQKDEKYTKQFMSESFQKTPEEVEGFSLPQFITEMKTAGENYRKILKEKKRTEPSQQTFGLPSKPFERNVTTGLFDDDRMIKELLSAMDDPISNFGPRNVPKVLKSVEVMGIMQARKWEIGTLNDFRDFFGKPRHDTFESVTKNVDVQNALRDLYEHPDKIELYPGVFCESDASMSLDPGPSEVDSALWVAIFSDAITLVRSDRFYTVDWNTNSLTSWGMKEVTPETDVCKSSVFHRLIQRAFPGWFPYNSIRFFHPFYTAKQNAIYAQAQGYGPDFRFTQIKDDKFGNANFDVKSSNANRPLKPVYLTEADKITAVLDKPYDFVHPAFNDSANFPEEIWEVFRGATNKREMKKTLDPVKEDTVAITKYFNELMRHVIKRESVTMGGTTYQIDATRDYAIPVTTRYVADFLGFGHLIRDSDNPGAPYTENSIYQHITNCQIFMSYNADETKLLRRRKAFKTSLKFLYDLTLNGNIYEADRWGLSRLLFGRKRTNPMTELGFEIAERISRNGGGTARAAAIMVFVGLHTAYNSVLAFTSVLNKFISEMYDYANASPEPSEKPTWFRVQELAFSTNEASVGELTSLVLDTERSSVRLPVIRVAARASHEIKGDLKGLVFEKGETIICDIHRANSNMMQIAKDRGILSKDIDFLGHKSSVTDHIADYDPKRIAAISVTTMIKIIAQMKNPRRGHDAQGRLKKVNIDGSAEGYANYMAPMRVRRIAELKKARNPAYDDSVLKPATETYLTPEWDEMVPFPNTWKIRFDGFGQSDYRAKEKDGKVSTTNLNLCGSLFHQSIDLDALAAPPFYQPQGLSHTGGAFATCACNTPGVACECRERAAAAFKQKAEGKTALPVSPEPAKQTPAELEATVSKGCGVAH